MLNRPMKEESKPPQISCALAALGPEDAIIYRQFLSRELNFKHCEELGYRWGLDPQDLFAIKNLFDAFTNRAEIDKSQLQGIASVLAINASELEDIRVDNLLSRLSSTQRKLLNYILRSRKFEARDLLFLALPKSFLEMLIQKYEARVGSYTYSLDQIELDPISLIRIPSKPEVQHRLVNHLAISNYQSPDPEHVEIEPKFLRIASRTLNPKTETQDLEEIGRLTRFVYMLKIIRAHSAAAFGVENLDYGVEIANGNRVDQIICGEVVRKYVHYLGISNIAESETDAFINAVKIDDLATATDILRPIIRENYTELFPKFFRGEALWSEGVKHLINVVYTSDSPLPIIITKPVETVIALFTSCLEQEYPIPHNNDSSIATSEA